MLRRRNSDTAVSPGDGGLPRPSFRWQPWQERELNSGPSPSDEWVELGAETHSLRKMPSPTLNSSWRSKLMLADGWEKALMLIGLREVAAPAEFAS